MKNMNYVVNKTNQKLDIGVGYKEQNYRNWFFTGGVWCREDKSFPELFPDNKIIVDLFLKYHWL